MSVAAGLDDLATFATHFPFPLDPFQREACQALAAGSGVLVCAPTGAGKTVVGEYAVHRALAQGRKCFYTTPIKALSNQKYADLVRRHGAGAVGLLTGDTSINGDAPVVVMTTEVLRNMLYADSPALLGLGYVVMDEVHYLADRFRGAVWEEVILHLPREVALIGLSATVSNAEEFGEWLVTVRGDTEIVLCEERPVPLFQHVMAGHQLFDLFQGGALTGDLNPRLQELAREEARWAPDRGRGGHRRGPRPPRDARFRTPGRPEMVERLEREGLLPGIVFVFSRNGCQQAVEQCVRAGLRLISDDERTEVRRVVDERTSHLPEEDLRVLGFWEWREALERGVAGHHAGMLPTFKEVVEELFANGLVRVVFATETLALGVNMPARSVTLTSLTKWNGETHADITPGEYTQLTGRAGRRGIDVEGHGIVLWVPGLDPEHTAGLASTRTYPLRSSFRPSYNMAVNLVGQLGREPARALLEQSFAQFQSDRAVVGLARQVTRNERRIAELRGDLERSGPIESYDALRRAIKDREAWLSREGAHARRTSAVEALERLRPGDVIRIPAGRSAGLAVVLEAGVTAVPGHAVARGAAGEGPRPVVLTSERQVRRLSIVDFPSAPEQVARVRVPRSFNARNAQSRRDLAATLRTVAAESHPGRPRRQRSLAADDDVLAGLRAELRAHPVHGWADREESLRQADSLVHLQRETAKLRQRMETRTGSLGRTFDQICLVLATLGYLSDDGSEVSAAGRRLARVYSESDLVVAECLAQGVWEGLDPAGLAACLSALVYESRRDDVTSPAPPPAVRGALADTARVWGTLRGLEAEHRLQSLRDLDLGFAWAAHRWASGHSLASVLEDTDLTAGDFVRQVRQLIDLADQLAGPAGAGTPVQPVAARTVAALRRGVVAPGAG